jgi:hypothetical protein
LVFFFFLPFLAAKEEKIQSKKERENKDSKLVVARCVKLRIKREAQREIIGAKQGTASYVLREERHHTYLKRERERHNFFFFFFRF